MPVFPIILGDLDGSAVSEPRCWFGVCGIVNRNRFDTISDRASSVRPNRYLHDVYLLTRVTVMYVP